MRHFLILITLAVAIPVKAQYYEPDEKPKKTYSTEYNKFFNISLDFNKPLSNPDWVSKVSIQGFKIGFKKVLDERFSAGIDVNWSTYSQYQPTTTFVGPSSAITTDYFKYVNTYGIVLNWHYFPMPIGERKLLPYVGVGLGASHHQFILYYNIYDDTESSWGFVARPEIGVMLPLGRKAGITAGFHFDYSTAKSTLFDYHDFMNIGFHVGVLFMGY